MAPGEYLDSVNTTHTCSRINTEEEPNIRLIKFDPLSRNRVRDNRERTSWDTSSDDLKRHLTVDRGDPLSIGTAIHMMTASVRPCKVHDRGFLYEDVHHTGCRVTYLSETFSLSQFIAILQINLGTLDGVPRSCVLVCSP